MTKPSDRGELIKWIGTKTEGASIAEVVEFLGMSVPHVEAVLRRQRKLGTLILIGKPPLCRWATPETAAAVTMWRMAHAAEVRARQRERSRLKRSIYQRRPPRPKKDNEWTPMQRIVPASQCQAPRGGVRSVFEWAAA